MKETHRHTWRHNVAISRVLVGFSLLAGANIDSYVDDYVDSNGETEIDQSLELRMC